MKKIIPVLSLLISFIILPLQGNTQNRVEFGIKGGVNFANISDESFDATTHTGFIGGVYTRFPITENPVSIQPEVLYTQKGFKFENTAYRIDYVEVPLLARIELETDSDFVSSIYFGPYIGFKVNTELPPRIVYYYNDSPQICTSYCYPPPPLPDTDGFYEGDINNTDLGLAVGGSLNFGRIDLGVRYQVGLTKISDDENVSARHSVFSILAGIGF